MADTETPPDDEAPPASGSPLGWATWGLVGLAAIKVAGAAVSNVWLLAQAPHVTRTMLDGFDALQLAAFAGAACVLLIGHARDARTARLGTLLIVIASAFSSGWFGEFAAAFAPARLIAPLQPDAFLAWCVGCFIQVFPQPRLPGRLSRALDGLVRLAGIIGLVLFAANALAGWHILPADLTVLMALRRTNLVGTVYWTAMFAVVLLMLPLSLSGTGRLDANTRRRVRMFLGAFLVGLGPLVIASVLMALPRVGGPWSTWAMRPIPFAAVELCVASIPITVAWAVLVQRVLPVRVVMRLAVQYLLARWTVTVVFMVPVCVLVVQGYRLRHETIAEAISGTGAWLVTATALAGLVLFSREELRRAIDRWFFREAYDAREILMTLGEQSRRANRLDELVATLTAGIDRALRPDSLAVLILDDVGTHFISPFGSVEPLATGCVLAEVLGVTRGPLDVQLEAGRSPLRWLPRDERQWLVDSRAALLVPMRNAGGGLVGLITIGERRSEMPFSTEDRWLLSVIADSGALAIENHAMRAGSGDPSQAGDAWRVGLAPDRNRAFECPTCGLLQASADSACARCGAALLASDVPAVLFGKFRFEERVGRGGMGVVYRATDLALDRVVAIKTLPGTSPEHSQRLRVEARAMAAVTHRHLAIIHGAESWHGRPMLICEFMARGTLATRLSGAPLPVAEALELGIALADALRVIHAAGLLHRDIKPSNIGYSQDGVPKLLDFGLVHMLMQAPSSDGPAGYSDASLPEDADPLVSLSVSRPMIGTPLYLSPEASHGHRPTAAFDLWSLNVLLIEAITGRHPFRGATVADTVNRVRTARVDEAWTAQPAVSRNLMAYFERALAKDPAFRIRTAGEAAEALRGLAREL